MRVIVHGGLHKTGSSTIQAALMAGRASQPRWRFALRPDIPGIAMAARNYCDTGERMELGLYQAAMAEYLADLPNGLEGLLISSERITGRMPGAADCTSYAAAPALLGKLAEVLRAQFGQGVDLVFYLSLRDPDSWIDSLHYQQVRNGTVTETQAAFRARIAPGFDLAPILDAIRAEIAPAQLVLTTLEETSVRPEGPVGPLLDLMGLKDAARTPFIGAPRRNSRPRTGDLAALADALAEVNTRGLDSDAAEAAKREIMKAAWRADAEASND